RPAHADGLRAGEERAEAWVVARGIRRRRRGRLRRRFLAMVGIAAGLRSHSLRVERRCRPERPQRAQPDVLLVDGPDRRPIRRARMGLPGDRGHCLGTCAAPPAPHRSLIFGTVAASYLMRTATPVAEAMRAPCS